MPLNLDSIEKGYGEVDLEWKGHSILLRYRADLNTRGLLAMQRASQGIITMDGVTRFPDVQGIMAELVRVLLPSGPDVPEDERGWDLTRGADEVSVPITIDTLSDLEYGLLVLMLGTLFRDTNADPKSRRPFKPTSSRGAVSQPIESRIISASSSEPSATDSTPTTSPTPITSIQRPEPSSPPTSRQLGGGYAGLTGTGS